MKTESIEFNVPDHSVFTKDRKFKDLSYNEKMYLSHLRIKGFEVEWYNNTIGQWKVTSMVPYLDSRAYRPIVRDDDVNWSALPFDWVVRHENGHMFNCEEDPRVFEEFGSWDYEGQSIRIDQLLTTKNNGKHWTESKQEKPENFKL